MKIRAEDRLREEKKQSAKQLEALEGDLKAEREARIRIEQATEEEKKASEKRFIEESPTSLIDLPETRELFTHEELERLIPIAEKQWIESEG